MKRLIAFFLVFCMILPIVPARTNAASASSLTIQNGVLTKCSTYASGELVIPDTVTRIADAAFNQCTGLTSVVIPGSVTYIGAGAFNECINLRSITLGNGITTIADGAFAETPISSLVIPESVTSIHPRFVWRCMYLTDLTVASGNPKYKSDSGLAILDKDESSLVCVAPGATSYHIPDGIVSIAPCAFEERIYLTDVTIPDSVTSIGEYAFNRCKALTGIVIPDSVTTMGSYAFMGCESMTEVSIGRGLEAVPDWAFSQCKKLTDITFHGKINAIGKSAFSSCPALTSLVLPDGVTSIGDSAFSVCSGLTTVTIPDSVTSIGQDAFYRCSSLTDITLPAGISTIAYSTFGYCSGLKSIAIPDSVTKIESYAFSGCSGLTEITLPKNLTQLESRAFENCTGLISVTIPDGVTRVEDSLFDGCTSLSQVTLPKNITYLGSFVFEGCANLHHVDIPDGLQTIEPSAFRGCSGLNTITIPKSVKLIDSNAFLNTGSMTDIYYAGTEEEWKQVQRYYRFPNDTSNAQVHFNSTATGYQLNLYSTQRDLSVRRGDEMKVFCILTEAGKAVSGWASPACTVGSPDVIRITDWKAVSSGGYWLTVTGLKAGTSSLTVTDPESGAYVTVDIQVNDTDAIPYTDLITNVPHFYPQVFGDRDTLTNFYNISEMYMRDFPYASDIKPVDGYYELSFTIYSTSSMYGSVDVYDEDGNWKSATRINKFPPTPTSVFEIGADTFMLVADACRGATLSYTANSFSAETKVSIRVPVGGYFTISNNALESPSCMLYNSLDLMLETLSLGADITFTAKDLIGIQDEIVAQALLKPAFMDAFLSQTNDFIKDAYQSATLENTAEFISEFTNVTVEILADQGIDVWAILKASLNISTDVAVKVLTPKFISATIGLLLTGNKAANMLCQAVQIKYSEDNDYVVLHTANSGKKIYGVEVKDDNNVLPEGALMQVFRVGEYEAFAYELEGKPMQAENFTLYNICFMKGGKEVNPSGRVEVMIPKPEGYRDCVILHQQEDGTWTPVNYWTVDGILHFYVNHFSLFAVVDTGSTGGDAVTRVFGADRYQTAYKAADELKQVLGVAKFQNIIVACGTNFPDALSGTYLAARKNAPILLVKGNNVAELNQYIRNNLADGGTLYLLGDNGVVPDSVGKDITGITVKRLGGATRYDTNLLILNEAVVGSKDIIVCTGLNFADSLSASASGLPILLVKGGLTDAQKAFLASSSGKKIIVGGTAAVSASVEAQLKTYGEVKRLAGDTRYDTSVLVAKEFFQNPPSAVLAYARNFPDGLSGGPLAYALNAPLILTDSNKPTAAVTYATGLGIKSGYVLGGSGLISDNTVKKVFSMAASENIVVE